MVSDYVKARDDFDFEIEEEIMDNTIGFISAFRNFKQENNIFKDYSVMLEGDSDYSLIKKMLKLDDYLVNEVQNKPSFNVSYADFKAVVFYEKQETEEERQAKEKQIESLKTSIKKREGLLSNQGFVSKAPEKLVEDEKNKLDEERKQLSILLDE